MPTGKGDPPISDRHVSGFLTDHAEKMFGSRTWVWVSRADDPFLYWFSNTTSLVMGALIVAGSTMIVLKAANSLIIRNAPLPQSARSRPTRPLKPLWHLAGRDTSSALFELDIGTDRRGRLAESLPVTKLRLKPPSNIAVDERSSQGGRRAAQDLLSLRANLLHFARTRFRRCHKTSLILRSSEAASSRASSVA
jgi:hypothetical protein